MTEFCKKDKVTGELKNSSVSLNTAYSLKKEFEMDKIKVSFANKGKLDKDTSKKLFNAFLRGYCGNENYEDVSLLSDNKEESKKD
ncbi:MAG: hypothetical protein M1124_01875 [Candidatus Marsarchaeota archaeon]|jgi:hypothetical protein|nr:hypothetical protein [Candidatus Marsarchaeota archaeon]